MLLLCLTIVVQLPIFHCATEITPGPSRSNATESLFNLKVSSGGDGDYPFCAWPADIIINECDKNISLLCVIHGCIHGAKIIIGNQAFIEDNGLNPSCVKGPNSDLHNGTLLAHLTLNIFDIAKNWSSSEPIPMYCATGDNQSEVAHISILTNCSKSDIVTSSASNTTVTIIQTPTPRLSSSIRMTIISPTPTFQPPNSSTLSPTLFVSPTYTPTSAYHIEMTSSIITLILTFFASIVSYC